MTNRLKDIRAVHMLRQYCRSANLMRTAYVGTAQDFQADTPISELFSPADGKDIAPTWLWLRNWLASLNVLIEGWSRLKLSDPRIDASLSRLKQDGDLKVLKDFRNAVYHFEPDPVDSRFVQLLFVGTASGTVGRLMRLQDQFDPTGEQLELSEPGLRSTTPVELFEGGLEECRRRGAPECVQDPMQKRCEIRSYGFAPSMRMR